MMPRSADEKPHVLHKVQGSIHFEKTLPASNASNAKKFMGLTVPSWFVQKHGNKIEKTIILRTESSTEPWPMNLSIEVYPVHTQVYVFRSMEPGPYKNPSPKQRRCTYNSAHSRGKAKQPYCRCRDARLSADEERSDNGKNGSKRKSSAVYDSAIAPTPPSCKEDVDSSHHLPSFQKTLTATNVRDDGKAFLEFPARFCRKYGNRIRTMVELQGIHEQSPERTMACHTSFGRDIRHYLSVGWRAFVTENHLHEGQQLLFTLSADSFFVVRERSAL